MWRVTRCSGYPQFLLGKVEASLLTPDLTYDSTEHSIKIALLNAVTRTEDLEKRSDSKCHFMERRSLKEKSSKFLKELENILCTGKKIIEKNDL